MKGFSKLCFGEKVAVGGLKCEGLELRQWQEWLNFSETEELFWGEEEQRNPKVWFHSFVWEKKKKGHERRE